MTPEEVAASYDNLEAGEDGEDGEDGATGKTTIEPVTTPLTNRRRRCGGK
jgi:hypothetical protein